ncbi:hypothetical protein FQN60_012795 [Etheostoma spectabile]|uniref:Mpv17-like protein 2 n=1 Tax=Etheostoma spectabile TaxID=54343 RepID=A0A5J5D8Z8_9PERO|nr:hypothetical protein FQN60_012795 [Etheostoma spectabile]
MLPRVGKEFMLRISFNWRPLFQGRALLLTNTLSGGVLLAVGDIVQQTRENMRKPDRVRDWRRTGQMFTVGCSMAPMLQYWYIWLDKVFVGKALKTIGKKVLVDQLVASPEWVSWRDTLYPKDGRSSKTSSWSFIRQADCCVWPPAQMINFYFISPKFRVLYINFVTIGWDTYLSYLKHRQLTLLCFVYSFEDIVRINDVYLMTASPLSRNPTAVLWMYSRKPSQRPNFWRTKLRDRVRAQL